MSVFSELERLSPGAAFYLWFWGLYAGIEAGRWLEARARR